MAIRFVDLFCGIGGFHEAVRRIDSEAQCVLACDIDAACQDVYEANFGLRPFGDIKILTEGPEVTAPAHDLLCAGFPCQPFSKSGFQRGINETRGTLFFNILKVLEARRPRFVLLENVRNLAGPRHRPTWITIVENLRALGYRVADEPTIFSPHLIPPEFGGGPQARERVFVLAERALEGDNLVGAPLNIAKYTRGWDPRSWDVNAILDDDAAIEDLDRYSLRSQELDWIKTWNELIGRLQGKRLPGFPMWADYFVDHPILPNDAPAWKQDFVRKNSLFYLDNRDVIDTWLKKHERLSSFTCEQAEVRMAGTGAPRGLWKLVLHFQPSGIQGQSRAPASCAALRSPELPSSTGGVRRGCTPEKPARLQGLSHSSSTLIRSSGDPTVGNAVHVGVVSLLLATPCRRRHPTRSRATASRPGAGLIRDCGGRCASER